MVQSRVLAKISWEVTSWRCDVEANVPINTTKFWKSVDQRLRAEESCRLRMDSAQGKYCLQFQMAKLKGWGSSSPWEPRELYLILHGASGVGVCHADLRSCIRSVILCYFLTLPCGMGMFILCHCYWKYVTCLLFYGCSQLRDWLSLKIDSALTL